MTRGRDTDEHTDMDTDQLEYMSLEGGRAYNESLMPFCTGKVQPNRSIPVQWMMHDIWKEMRDLDNDLADDVVEPVFLFMRAQTAKERLSITDLHQYLKYRQGDVGQAYVTSLRCLKLSTDSIRLLAALMRFSYDLRLSPEELSFVSDIEKNCGRHISLVNDVFSYEKEKLISEREASEGAILCNAVQILSDQVQISIEAAKKVLLILARDCETTHNELLEKKDSTLPGLGLKDSLKRYIKGLEYQMSGNELWSRTTCRYKKTKVDSEKAVVAGTPKALCKKRPLENDENERMDKTSNKHRVMSSDLIPPEPLVDVFVQ